MNVDWMSRASCRDHDPELFFPVIKGPEAKHAVQAAISVCEQCPVIKQCGDYADRLRVQGIWGGVKRQPAPGLGEIYVHGTESAAVQHRRRGETPCNACRNAASLAKQIRNERATA